MPDPKTGAKSAEKIPALIDFGDRQRIASRDPMATPPRKAVRTIDALWQEIGHICDLFEPAECSPPPDMDSAERPAR